MSMITEQVIERVIGGVLAPIIILLISIELAVHSHGYLPVWVTPIVLVIALAGTDQYRRPITIRRPTGQHAR